MSNVDLRERTSRPAATPEAHGTPAPPDLLVRAPRFRVLPVLVTLIAVAGAAVLGWAAWRAYMAAPWTRDGTVRAYVVTMAPEVAGRIVSLPIVDNQLVHKGDTLLVIDPTDYAIAVDQAQAAMDQARATADNAQREAQRRASLSTLETSEEEKQTYQSNAVAAEASYRQALATLARVKVNLQRTTIHAPVNGYVTHLLVQLGDYATAGQAMISLVNADSFWVDGYFEETSLPQIHAGDHATIRLMGARALLTGHVASVARGIAVANADSGPSGLANVNPIFTWVRLAQRVPVRIHIDHVPPGISLVAGETASVQIDRR